MQNTPHYNMFGVNIGTSKLQEFGSPAWVFVPPGMRKPGKLSSRSVRGTFLGVGLPLGNPAYFVQINSRIIQSGYVTGLQTKSTARGCTQVHAVCYGLQPKSTAAVLPF